MITLIQRVKEASVSIDSIKISSINAGILAFIAFTPADKEPQLIKMSDKILGYRIFSDNNGRMNRNIIDEKLDLLIVPQFTLAANTKSGTRPSFSCAANPQIGRDLFIQFLEIIKSKYRNIESGKFKENMDVSLINDGPVTFWLEVN